MTLLVALATVATTTGTVVPTWATGLPVDTDWLVAEVRSDRPAGIALDFWVAGHVTGEGPLVIGGGLANPGARAPYMWNHVRRLGGGPSAVTLTLGRDSAGTRLRLDLDEHGNFTVMPVGGSVTTTHAAVLVYVDNAVLDYVVWEPSASDRDTITTSITAGSGTHTLRPDGADGGASASAATVSTGTGTFEHRTRTGIVGAFEYLSCHACTGTWRAPGRTSPTHRWANVRHHAGYVCWCGGVVQVDTTFAGGPGRWAWSWSGAIAPEPAAVPFDGTAHLAGHPIVAMYAPVGPRWKLFDPCGYPDGCGVVG